MKKLNLLMIVSTATLLLAVGTNVSYAAKNYKGQTVTVDGVQVSYDPTAINGGIDLTSETGKKVAITTRGILEQKEIFVPFETQINNYYLGTAATSMLANSINISTNQHKISSLFDTATTNINSEINLLKALNKVVAGSNFKFYWQEHNDVNDINTIRTHIVSAIEHGNPVMVNTAEGPGDTYLRGHNTGYRLYNVGIISGFYNYGNRVKYIDPGYGRFSGFVKSQVTTIKNLSYATGTRGYAW